VNPRKAEWPEADFVVGNPPFIGNKRMRDELGSGYVEALRSTLEKVPESADFVMYWWQHAAELTRRARVRRFGLITGRGPWKKRLPQLLDTLVAVGRARPTDAGYVTTS